MNRYLGDRRCALIREFSLPITDPYWHYGAPSAFALRTSEEFKNYHRVTENGKFAGNFHEFVFMYQYVFLLDLF